MNHPWKMVEVVVLPGKSLWKLEAFIIPVLQWKVLRGSLSSFHGSTRSLICRIEWEVVSLSLSTEDFPANKSPRDSQPRMPNRNPTSSSDAVLDTQIPSTRTAWMTLPAIQGSSVMSFFCSTQAFSTNQQLHDKNPVIVACVLDAECSRVWVPGCSAVGHAITESTGATKRYPCYKFNFFSIIIDLDNDRKASLH